MMDTRLKILITSIFIFVFISCEQNTNPIGPDKDENGPIVIQTMWSALPNSPVDGIYTMASNAEGVLYAGVTDGLYRSLDNGLSWENIYSAGVPKTIYDSPTDSMIFLSLLGTFNTTTIYSPDKGETWKQPEEPPASTSIGLYLTLPNGDILAGGYVHDESAGGLYLSHDQGEIWQRHSELGTGLSIASLVLTNTHDIFALVIYPLPNYAAVISRSQDSGKTWSEITRFDTLRVFDLLANSQGDLILNSENGIMISEDRGQNWEILHPYFQKVFALDIAIDSDDNLVAIVNDREDGRRKILLLPTSGNTLYSLGEDNLPSFRSGEWPSLFIGKDKYVYFYSIYKPIYKSNNSIHALTS